MRSELLIFVFTSAKPFTWLISLGKKQEVQGNSQKLLYSENEFYHLPDLKSSPGERDEAVCRYEAPILSYFI